jgi:hypothetical protein
VARLAKGGLEPEFTDVDVRQSDVPALGAELMAPLPNPGCSSLEFLTRHLLVLRFRPAVGGQELSGEDAVTEEAGPNLNSSNSFLKTWQVCRRQLTALNEELLSLLGAHLDRPASRRCLMDRRTTGFHRSALCVPPVVHWIEL